MSEHAARQGVFLSSSTYDFLKFVAQIVLPGLGTLYFALSGLWGFPNPEEVVGTIVAVDTFLGLLLGFSTKKYNDSDLKYDGEIEVEQFEDDGVIGKRFNMELNSSPDDLDQKKEIVFKVKTE